MTFPWLEKMYLDADASSPLAKDENAQTIAAVIYLSLVSAGCMLMSGHVSSTQRTSIRLVQGWMGLVLAWFPPGLQAWTRSITKPRRDEVGTSS